MCPTSKRTPKKPTKIRVKKFNIDIFFYQLFLPRFYNIYSLYIRICDDDKMPNYFICKGIVYFSNTLLWLR